jgi:uncharacterized membrane protein
MSKQIRWLAGELDGWVAKGLVTSQQAAHIRQLYPEPKAGLPWGAIVFSGIGAVIVGLGVVLLFAYNWAAIPKAGKLSVIFLALLSAHGAGLRLFSFGDWRRPVGEALCVLGTMFFGAGIWLIAQIYHIEEHFPTGFLVWGLGALAMAWALPSVAHGLLATVLLAIWAGTESLRFDTPVHWAALSVLAGAGTLAWRERSRVLLFFVLAAFVFSLLSSAGALHGELILRVLLNVAVLFVALEILTRRHAWFAESAPVWGFFGWLGFLTGLFLLTFPELADDVLGWRAGGRTPREFMTLVYEWLPLLLALAGWVVVAWPWLAGTAPVARPDDCPFEHWLVPLSVIACQVFAISGLYREGWLVAGVFNLVLLALAAAWMSRGCREGRLRPTLQGSVLLTALALARYFDLFESLAARGLVFLVVGGVLFAEGVLFTRARRRAKELEGAS